jgi:hypothetical protein
VRKEKACVSIHSTYEVQMSAIDDIPGGPRPYGARK